MLPLSDLAFHKFSNGLGIVVLPHSNSKPAGFSKNSVRVSIAPAIQSDLVGPILRIRTRRALTVLRASVPEAPIDKHCNFGRAKDEVRTPPETWERLRINSVSQASSVKESPKSKLGFGVSGLLTLHTCSDLWIACPRLRFCRASDPFARSWPATASVHQSDCYTELAMPERW